jgi:hypothetical protein
MTTDLDPAASMKAHRSQIGAGGTTPSSALPEP